MGVTLSNIESEWSHLIGYVVNIAGLWMMVIEKWIQRCCCWTMECIMTYTSFGDAKPT